MQRAVTTRENRRRLLLTYILAIALLSLRWICGRGTQTGRVVTILRVVVLFFHIKTYILCSAGRLLNIFVRNNAAFYVPASPYSRSRVTFPRRTTRGSYVHNQQSNVNIFCLRTFKIVTFV